MSTYMPKAGEITRKWYVLDAAGKPLGRTAALAASLLRGKHKTIYTPNIDCGDAIIIINAEKAVLTGKKLEQKKYYRHTGWVGGLKEVSYKDLMLKKPELAMELAIQRMLPANKLGADMMKRLRVYRGAEHKQASQKPENWIG